MNEKIEQAIKSLRDAVDETAEQIISSNKEATINSLQLKLSRMITDWKTDGFSPANFIREDGMGNEVAKVDRWLQHYQEPQCPVAIGWKALKGNSSISGILIVSRTEHMRSRFEFIDNSDKKDIEETIKEAKHRADEALRDLGWDLS